MRFLEYLYLLVAVGVSAYFAWNFKTMPLGNKIFLALVIVLCAFMFSFRRKQRQVLEDFEERERKKAEEAENLSDKETHYLDK
jgi:hypothetical protein